MLVSQKRYTLDYNARNKQSQTSPLLPRPQEHTRRNAFALKKKKGNKKNKPTTGIVRTFSPVLFYAHQSVHRESIFKNFPTR
jgi:hypothetical protein